MKRTTANTFGRKAKQSTSSMVAFFEFPTFSKQHGLLWKVFFSNLLPFRGAAAQRAQRAPKLVVAAGRLRVLLVGYGASTEKRTAALGGRAVKGVERGGSSSRVYCTEKRCTVAFGELKLWFVKSFLV